MILILGPWKIPLKHEIVGEENYLFWCGSVSLHVDLLVVVYNGYLAVFCVLENQVLLWSCCALFQKEM